MAIKSKGWTAIPAVKLVSFALILVLAFAFGGTVFSMARLFDNTENQVNMDLDIVFGNASGNDLFYRSYMSSTVNDLKKLLFFESEENIKAGNCLKWVEDEGGLWLTSSDDSRTWSSVSVYEYPASGYTSVTKSDSGEVAINWGEPDEPQEEQGEPYNKQQMQLQMESLEKNAINNQLQTFRQLQAEIQSRNGLVYYVSKGSFEQSNVGHSDVDFYVRQPVYTIVENGLNVAQSHNLGVRATGNATIYVGYTAEAIDAQTALWQSMQRIIILQIAAIIVIVLLVCVLFVVLLCGAGRKPGSNAIYFNVLDKPYLDVGFGLIILYAALVCELFLITPTRSFYGDYSVPLDWHDSPQYVRSLLISLAITLALMLPPVLYYAMSFAKRFKAGGWWQYTLTWRMWDSVKNTCVNFAKSLWAGVPLTLRVGVICFFLFCVMLIVAAASNANEGAIIMAFFASVAIAFPMLKYARKLNKLETGAKAVSEGKYGDIDLGGGMGGGTLGRIAESVNNISAGIESAVDERLRSERLKTELITNVSHDIRTPLTSLITYTDLLKSEGLTSERAPEYLDILIQKSQRLKTLTDELFEAAKASSGNIETHIEALDFAALTRQVLGELDERIQSSGLDFRTNLPEHMWVAADGKLLWRAAENLLSNVFKYSLPHSRVYIDLAGENGYARLDIKNISAEPLNMEPSELTERFKRGDVSRSSEGSGLGLSIVQSFVEAQGGRFKIAIDGDLFKASISMPTSEPKKIV